jgi:hypothetical protein
MLPPPSVYCNVIPVEPTPARLAHRLKYVLTLP